MNRRQFASGLLATAASSAFAAPHQGVKNLILVTADGMRWQEFFTGIDPALASEKDFGMGPDSPLRQKLWKPTPEERRLALLPYFWTTLAPSGIVIGNVLKESVVTVANRFRFSYPGYAELLTGRTQDDRINTNNKVQNPTPTVLQFLKRKWGLQKEQVGVFASWEVFTAACENQRGDIFINAGYQITALPKGVDELNRLQFEALYTEDSARHDIFTIELALAYLRSIRPHVFYLALDETDDWAHAKRYDRTLQAIQIFDNALKKLWTWVQSTPGYRNQTLLVVSCDHGRGSTRNDWDSHGEKVPGDENVWVAFAGPGVAARGEMAHTRPCHTQDIVPTALQLMGIPPSEYEGCQGTPIAELTS